MRSDFLIITGLSVALMGLIPVAGAQPLKDTPNPKYLLFEMSSFLPRYPQRPLQETMAFFPSYTGTLDPDKINEYAITKANIEFQVNDMLAAVNERGDHVHRQLGFMIGALTFDLKDEQIRTVIDNAFAVAEEKDVAVGFHIDDSMFWINRKDLWSDKNNVEWNDWQGTVVPHRMIGWVEGGASILAPPMCYTSPAIKQEAKRIAGQVIGAEIKKHIDHLKTIGKSYLFAGVISDWEPHLQDDSNPPVFYGYCALHHLGFSAENPPKDIDQALLGVMSNWIILWDKTLYDAGIPRNRIFTHIAFPGLKPPPEINLPPNFNLLRQFYGDSDPNVTAFNQYSYPGFSVYSIRHFAELYQVLAAHGNPPWGVSEGNNAEPPTFVPLSTMEQYLASAYNHGASYVTLFSWFSITHDPNDPTIAGSVSIAAYRKFLKGGELQEGAPGELQEETPFEPDSSSINGMFKPEFILSHQQELGLTEDQRQSIINEVMGLQAKLPQLQDGPEKLHLLLDTINRINNVLSTDQKEKLKTLKGLS